MLDDLREKGLTWCKKLRARLLGFANGAEIDRLRKQLEAQLQQGPRPKADPAALTGTDRDLHQHIQKETAAHNRNNVTRTAAYLAIFQRCPELHWALLAHMVSRNGGYNMTDLRGDLIGRVLEAGEGERFFHYLERANFLIFGDAYPQLLLYEASRDAGRPFFHLLPYFGVSRFMDGIWQQFWETNDSELLTMALVVNEQNYINHRVVQNPAYSPVQKSFEFRAQTLLNLTQVAFPFFAGKEERLQLAGVTVKTFLSLAERIDTGRRLYAILFGQPGVYEGVLRFAEQTPHTGSRADYWPHLYTVKSPGSLAGTYHPRLQGSRLKKGAPLLYSPTLAESWPDVANPEPPGGGDWCVSAECAEELYGTKPSRAYNITGLTWKTLALVERAVAAETWIRR